jgi:hypothetical protein
MIVYTIISPSGPVKDTRSALFKSVIVKELRIVQHEIHHEPTYTGGCHLSPALA